MTTQPFILDITRRPRRTRRTPGIRDLVSETHLRATDLIQPLFVKQGGNGPEPIESMPGQFRLREDDLLRECDELLDLGIRGVALIPKIAAGLKEARGSDATNRENW